jgi:hypothetical protein
MGSIRTVVMLVLALTPGLALPAAAQPLSAVVCENSAQGYATSV